MPRTRPCPSVTLVALPLAMLLGACSAVGGGGLGSVPGELVDLYDLARPDGVIEVEVDRDGSIREMEAEVPIDALPRSVVAAANARHPGAPITGAEREITKAGAGWEVKMEVDGRDVELVFDESGNLLEFEREIDRSEAPRAVIDAAQREVPDGSFVSVETVEHLETLLYHVKFERDGATYKVILTPQGAVERKVREHRAEIEIPLR